MSKENDAPKNLPSDTDFAVMPPQGDGLFHVLRLHDELKRSIKAVDINKLRNPDESADDFLFRMAISYEKIGTPLFRKRDDADTHRVVAWTTLARESAIRFFLSREARVFSDLPLEAVDSIAKLSRDPRNVSKIPHILADNYGVILVANHAFSLIKMDGCTFALENGTPVIALTLRYNRYDSFWFTLMHELAHIALHYDRLDNPIIDDLDAGSESEIEIEANRVATDALVPRHIWKELWKRKEDLSSQALTQFAGQAGTHPSILAGILRHHTNKHWQFREFDQVLNVREAMGVVGD